MAFKVSTTASRGTSPPLKKADIHFFGQLTKAVFSRYQQKAGKEDHGFCSWSYETKNLYLDIRKLLFPIAQHVFMHLTVKHLKKAVWAVSLFIYKGRSAEHCYTKLAIQPPKGTRRQTATNKARSELTVMLSAQKPLLRFLVPRQPLPLSPRECPVLQGRLSTSSSCLASLQLVSQTTDPTQNQTSAGSQRKGQPWTAWHQHDVFLLNMAITFRPSSSMSCFIRDSRILNSPAQPASSVIPIPVFLTQMKVGLTT